MFGYTCNKCDKTCFTNESLENIENYYDGLCEDCYFKRIEDAKIPEGK